ncbi:GNAT family N-acetyltransferase [Mangrovibacterium marinum]|uniref:Phosphinothricin acetyltransferase n=1 Tax=Mangrovibacterium marinum TaxID=1639118 RepID=A0A2T5C142_9BACT|nr:GNAT family N-acetyltransferase [Mangrovibacterium marinum]PTN08331.1 phosphinothricin acetyltransferase [Mangrovibacterium marinum]
MHNRAEIRLATLADAEAILEIYKPFITDTVVTFEEIVPSVSEFRQRMAFVLKECPYLVCVVDGRIVGYAYAAAYRSRASYRWNREVTVYIHPEGQRKNIGTALYYALIEILKKQNFATLLAVVTLPNEGSARLHERVGFKPCAVFNQVGYKKKQWHRVGWWELALIPPEQAPVEPILFENFDEPSFLAELFRKAAEFVKI